MNKHVRNLFFEKFHIQPSRLYFAPGRVNIIGEHTDYNGGLVMPFCLDKGIYAAINRNDGNFINIYSENFSIHGVINIDLNELDFKKMDNYGDYLLGVIKELQSMNKVFKSGLNIVLSSNLTVGGGLSSSAALTVLLIKIFNNEFDFKLKDLEIVKIAKSVENNYLGVNCGIMDQFVIMFGKNDRAVYLDTKTLEYELIPLNLEDYNFVLVNSNISRKLKNSKYNERQIETQKALRILQKNFYVEDLSEIPFDMLDKALNLLKDENLRKRVKHVITENERVKEVKKILLANQIEKLGPILTEAHYSLKDDYEVSSEVIDELVEMALKSGALGSRMIGGGFGGSTLNIVLKANLDGFIREFQELYQNRYEKAFVYSIVYAKDGIKQID